MASCAATFTHELATLLLLLSNANLFQNASSMIQARTFRILPFCLIACWVLSDTYNFLEKIVCHYLILLINRVILFSFWLISWIFNDHLRNSSEFHVVLSSDHARQGWSCVSFLLGFSLPLREVCAWQQKQKKWPVLILSTSFSKQATQMSPAHEPLLAGHLLILLLRDRVSPQIWQNTAFFLYKGIRAYDTDLVFHFIVFHFIDFHTGSVEQKRSLKQLIVWCCGLISFLNSTLLSQKKEENLFIPERKEGVSAWRTACSTVECLIGGRELSRLLC